MENVGMDGTSTLRVYLDRRLSRFHCQSSVHSPFTISFLSILCIYRVLHKWRNEVKTDIRGKIHCIKHTNIAKCLYILGDFHSGTPGAYNWKKSWKTLSSKKVRFQGSLKSAHFLLIEIWGLPTFSSIILGISPSI